MSARVKRNLESVNTLKAAGASAAEARAAAAALQDVANDLTASSNLRARATAIYEELQGRPEDTARREALMQQASAIAAQYMPAS